MKPIQYDIFKDILYYDESSPSFARWATSGGRRRVKDRVAGSVGSYGYYVVNLKFGTFLVHRIIYALHTKQDLPCDMTIDHIDRNRANNCLSNLRLVTPRDNTLNRSKGSNNTSGVLGVHWDNQGFWRAKWNENGVVRRKTFNPKRMYPDIPEEDAKRMAFEEAVKYRKDMENRYYKLGENYGE